MELRVQSILCYILGCVRRYQSQGSMRGGGCCASSTPSSETLWEEAPGIRCIPLPERPCHRIRIRSHSDRKSDPTNTPLSSIPWAAVSTLDMVVHIRNNIGAPRWSVRLHWEVCDECEDPPR